MSPNVTAAVEALLQSHPRAKLALTGHSLGGALATLAAIDLKSRLGLPVDSLYTFGCPRCMNAALASHSAALIPTVRRMTHWRDVVPHVRT